MRIYVPLPTSFEQQLIGLFLDRETGKIDALIAEQERLMELLKVKRQAVISHAVTKGLNPDAPMKDSRVEWLGEVPTHWELIRVKNVVRTIEQGWSPQCESGPAEGENEWGVLKVGCVNGGTFNSAENKLLPSELEPEPQLSVAAGDLLISRANTRELVGSVAFVGQAYPRLMICDKLYRLRFDETRCRPQFISAFLRSSNVRSQIELIATGASASMVNIPQSAIMEMQIALPSLDEQLDIVGTLEGAIESSVELLGQSELTTALLRERRTALISAAVTGQIDVRGLANAEAP